MTQKILAILAGCLVAGALFLFTDISISQQHEKHVLQMEELRAAYKELLLAKEEECSAHLRERYAKGANDEASWCSAAVEALVKGKPVPPASAYLDLP